MKLLHVTLNTADRRLTEAPVTVDLRGLDGHPAGAGLGRAIYAYPQEHYAFWRTVRAQARVAGWGDGLAPGAMGEQLTLDGLLEERLWVGDRLRLPGCVLAVSEPRLPGAEFDTAMGFGQAAKLMLQSGYCGSYLGVIEPGRLQAGDPIELIPGPRQVNLRDLFRSRIGAA